MDYSKTVNLPNTPFSMKANLVEKEPKIIEMWEKNRIYFKQLEKRAKAPTFILHDGPPYANGEIHLGTALNKILKDMIVKYKFFRGHKTPFIPGWDCHGLPIELKVVEQLGGKASEIPVKKLRAECRKYAEKYITIQRDGFRRLGCIGDWENPYLTMSHEYEAAIVEAFGRIVEKGLIYRGLRPVHWCLHCCTSLAEAEIEYHDHHSPSIYVKFPVIKHNVSALQEKPLFVLIWTTTPWTLPANTGLSFHPEEAYVAAEINGEYLIVAEKLLPSVASVIEAKIGNIHILTQKELESLKVMHPWIDRESRVVFGEHVTMDTGTGIVHTAPGHGMEDYLIGKETGLEMLSPVNDKGEFTPEVPEFQGMNVFDANEKIIQFLEEKNRLYARTDIEHSYPHCWRCKKPIIFRSKPQWFFKVSDPQLAKKALETLPHIQWIPAWGQTRIENMLKDRPDWCLSRQRHWGVPIPAFYCEYCNEPHLDKKTIDHIIGLIHEHGIDVWFDRDAAELLPTGTVCHNCGGKTFRKETDILDVWFDSGVSNIAVLDKHPQLHSPADVYLEGNDQYRGWFQASLWPSVAVKDKAPFKAIITHGWVLDEQGRQMHKSLGNAVSPREIYEKFGADVLRLWVVTEDYRGDLRIGSQLIQKAADSYRKVRNTFRFIMGNLDGFSTDKKLPVSKLKPVDAYMLSELANLADRVTRFFDQYEFYRGFRELYNFCAVDLSAFYLDILKDRLYIYEKESYERLSAQTVLYEILRVLTILFAPILSFTMEEVYQTYFAKSEGDSVLLQDWPEIPQEWRNDDLAKDFDALKAIRESVLKAIEALRSRETDLGGSLETKILLEPKNPYTRGLLEKYEKDIRFFFIVSQVEITSVNQADAEDDNVKVKAEKADGQKCARCWNYSVHVGEFSDYPDLCERCAPIVSKMQG
ncbi:isoleucine--tRNA ligase [Thermospira aquatica]|uniref:Isoleucine--tRNA ligase n=1 Tax=Thermospira aquatica TaxID=2828656 RepID=A0AAX3BG42_9SPIR|nr:isoleucine--tRNA ligase [Thermospira aquatica]URA11308.1 isoleucine--tRNA ligase [Thermospira aquatica]